MMTYTLAEAITVPFMFALIIAAGIGLHYWLKNKPEPTREIPLKVLAIIILISEVVKQIYCIWFKEGGWVPWDLPVHFCSFFLVWFAFALFSRGKLRQLAYSCCLSGGVAVAAMLICTPRMIIGNSCSNVFLDFGSIHTFFFHFIVMAYWIWLLFLRVYHTNKAHIWQTTLLYFGYFWIICAAAYIFNTNFTNALHTDIPFMEAIRVNAGQVVYSIVMFGIGVLLISGITTLLYFGLRMIEKTNGEK